MRRVVAVLPAREHTSSHDNFKLNIFFSAVLFVVIIS